MSPPLYGEDVEFSDGHKNDLEHLSEDITAFLMWTAEPKLNDRKRAGLVGVLILGFIQNGLLLVGLQFYVQYVVTWVIIILAVWLDVAAKRGRLWSQIA